jgi:zinc/manganese transport system substrate-binding protein
VGEHEVASGGGRQSDEGGVRGDLPMVPALSSVLNMRTVLIRRSAVALAVVLGLVAAGCGSGGGGASSSSSADIVVTSNILGDVVRHLVANDAKVDVVMPPNADPHDFSASARQAADMRTAKVLVINGLGFEAGLKDTIDAARSDGAHVIEVAKLAPNLRQIVEAGENNGKPVTDPHVFTDPARFAVAVAGLADQLEHQVGALDTARFRARARAYVAQLHTLDADVERILAPIPPARRILVTNHDALGYFADRYSFRVLGTIIPSLSTLAEPSAADLADLAGAIDKAGVPAIFADTSSPARLADALAGEGHHVEVVALFVESLGAAGSGAATYQEMVRTNAERIVAALTG